MKIERIVVLGLAVAFAVPQMAQAKLPMTPQALGFLESTVDSCAKADPDSAEKYKERGKAFVSSATKEELEQARSSSDYKKSYDETTSDLSQLPKEKLAKQCADFLEGK